MIARALGHGMTVGVAQFIKGRSDTGEEAFFRNQPGVTWHVLGEGFTWETQNLERDRETARKAWDVVRPMLQPDGPDLIVLDEITYPLRYGWLDNDVILKDLAARPTMQHVVITGRTAPKEIVEAADTVSTIADTKHAYRAGVMAQKGVDL